MNKKTIDPKDEFLEVSVPYEKVGLCFSNVSIELVSSKHDVEDLGNIALSLYELIKELDKWMIPAGKKIHLLKNRINSLRSQIKQKEIELEKCMNDLKKLKG